MHERTLRRGFLACTLAALLSVLMPGLGHLAVRARFRRGVAAAIVGNLAATIVTVAIALPIRNKADLADVVADRPTFVGLGLALVVSFGLTAVGSGVGRFVAFERSRDGRRHLV